MYNQITYILIGVVLGNGENFSLLCLMLLYSILNVAQYASSILLFGEIKLNLPQYTLVNFFAYDFFTVFISLYALILFSAIPFDWRIMLN